MIGVLSLLPNENLPRVEITRVDLVAHFLLYMVFTILLINGNRIESKYILFKKYAVLTALVVSITYGGIIELIQGIGWLNRSADWFDFGMNAVGSLIGVIIYFIAYKIIK